LSEEPGVSNEQPSVAVLFFPQAVEAIGGALGGHLRDGEQLGPHVLCRQVNSNGPYFEMTFEGRDGAGNEVEMQVMVPHGYIRLVMSVRGDDRFGFARFRPGGVVPPAVAEATSSAGPASG
jgi:hypothetical protein